MGVMERKKLAGNSSSITRVASSVAALMEGLNSGAVTAPFTAAEDAECIIVIGALLQISSSNALIMWIAAFTVLITAVNIAGGFAVTRRMLDMFRK